MSKFLFKTLTNGRVAQAVVLVDENGDIISGGVFIDGSVDTFAELPDASLYIKKVYIVLERTGTWILGTRKSAGLYISNGIVWRLASNDLFAKIQKGTATKNKLKWNSILDLWEAVQLVKVTAPDLTLLDYDNYTTTGLDSCDLLELNPVTDVEITGLQEGYENRRLIITCISDTFEVKLMINSANSDTENRIYGEKDVRIKPNMTFELIYINNRWRFIGKS